MLQAWAEKKKECLDMDKRVGNKLSISERKGWACWPCEVSWRLIKANTCHMRDTVLNVFTPLFLKAAYPGCTNVVILNLLRYKEIK